MGRKARFPHATAGDGACSATHSLSYYTLPLSLCVQPDRGGWETLNPDTTTMTKHHCPLTWVRGRGLRKDGHASKQDPARGLQDEASDLLHQGRLYTINRDNHAVTITQRVECQAATAPTLHFFCILGVTIVFTHVKTHLPLRL